MGRIAVIVDDYFEDVEYSLPVKRFKEAGHDVVNVGLKEGKTVKGKKEELPVEIEEKVDKSAVKEFDALLIPGGYSPDKLRSHFEAVEFVKEFMESGKPVFSICHGPQLLITADVLKGRTLTGWKSIVQDIKNAGAKYVDSDVVEDGNLITSRGPSDLEVFVKTSLSKLE